MKDKEVIRRLEEENSVLAWEQDIDQYDFNQYLIDSLEELREVLIAKFKDEESER